MSNIVSFKKYKDQRTREEEIHTFLVNYERTVDAVEILRGAAEISAGLRKEGR